MRSPDAHSISLRLAGTAVVAFTALRLLLILSASDQVHAPDWAEVKHMLLGDQWVTQGPPTPSEVLAWGQDSRNAAHGGFLLVSLLYAVVVVPLQTTQSYLALKAIVLLFAVLGFIGWTGTALRLGGRLAGCVAALLFLFPPPTYLAGTSVAWGSHPEATALLGMAALLATSASSAGWRHLLALGLLLGASIGLSSLAAPIALAIAVGSLWDRRGPHWRPAAVSMALGLAVPVVAIGLLTGSPTASVTEEADHAPVDLLVENLDDGEALVMPSLREVIPIPAWGPSLLHQDLQSPQRQGLNGMLSLTLLLGLLVIGQGLRGGSPGPPHRGRVIALCVLGPALHIGMLVLLAPRRPSIEARYLLPLWPCLLLLLSLAVAQAMEFARTSPGRRWLQPCAVLAALLWLAPGLQVQANLLDPGRIGAGDDHRGFSTYQPGRYVAAEIGNVTYPTAQLVNDFLDQREPGIRGFSLVTRIEAGQDLLLEPPELEHQLDPIAIVERIGRDRGTQPSPGPERDRIYENLGWALSTFAPDRGGLWLGILSQLEGDRSATASGIGMGLAGQGPAGCAAMALGPPTDQASLLRGAIERDPDVLSRCGLATLPASPAPPKGPPEQTEANPPPPPG